MMLEPSLLYFGCSSSLRMKVMSAGVLLGVSSPSLGKVILVPAFQPFFTTTFSTFSSVRRLRPSGLRRLRVIFTCFVQPCITSSRVTTRSWTTALVFSRLWPFRGPASWPANPPTWLKVNCLKGLKRSSSPSKSLLKKMSKWSDPWKEEEKVAWGSLWKLLRKMLPGPADIPFLRPETERLGGNYWRCKNLLKFSLPY